MGARPSQGLFDGRVAAHVGARWSGTSPRDVFRMVGLRGFFAKLLAGQRHFEPMPYAGVTRDH